MKVVLVSTFEQHGGAAIACNRLMHALRLVGVDARMLVLYKTSQDNYVDEVSSSSLKKRFNLFVERLGIFVKNGFNRCDLFALSTATTGFNLSLHPWVKEADVINLHWVNQGLMSIKDIENLVHKHQKVVWTMHDMWPITGLCHHATNCTSYQYGVCESCKPYHYTASSRCIDTSRIKLVGVSRWLCDKAELSYKQLESTVIGNVIDCEHFKPESFDKITTQKELWKVPIDKKVIAMGAADLSTPLKGIELLVKALKSLPNVADYHLLLFGNVSKDKALFFEQLPVDFTYLGVVDYNTLPLIYNVADLVVVPSYYETFGQTISEAMACECPVVAFDSGGQKDIIDHKQTGYLARAWEPNDLAHGINWVLFELEDAIIIGKKARRTILERFSSQVIAQKYI
ncbi:glycosyltransferase [Gammaproteobacteria bacterium]|nr:glycosyltransferase [Gammaproteobacteria bacterium]